MNLIVCNYSMKCRYVKLRNATNLSPVHQVKKHSKKHQIHIHYYIIDNNQVSNMTNCELQSDELIT